MTRNTIINKHGKSLGFLVNLIGIPTFALTFIGIIPPEFKGNLVFKTVEILMLLAGFILLLPFLRGFFKSKSKITTVSGYCFVASIFILMFIFIGVQKGPQENTTTLAINSSTKSLENVSTIKKGNIEILNSPITTGDKSPVVIGNNTTFEQNNYNTPPQRRLNSKDLKKLKSIPITSTRIQLLYPSDNNEASTFGDEIFSKLFDLGHSNLSKGTIDMAKKNSANERFTIDPRKEPMDVINVIINPQQ